MIDRAKLSDEPAAAARVVQKPKQVPQAELSAPASMRVPPRLGGPAAILAMQQSVGNRAVMRMLAQAKLTDEPEEENVQRRAEGLREPSDAEIHSAGAKGVSTPATALPYLDRIQASFGSHPIGHVKAHTGTEASQASRAMSALAFASGDHVVFGATPDLRITAHEAAHVVQQQAGVQLAGGIGREGDVYERHADAVADAVAAGRPAEGLLEPFVASPGAGESGTSAGSSSTQVIHTRMAPAGRVQRVFNLIKADGKPVPKDKEDEIVGTLLQAFEEKKSILKQYDSAEEADTIDSYLKNPQLREEIIILLKKTANYGEVNVNNNQQLGFFYLKLKQQLDPKQREGQLESAGEEGVARARKFIDDLSSGSYDRRVRHSVGVWEGEEQASKIGKVYKLVLLGRGATIAYYISDNLSNIDVESSLLIGEEQPWRGTRGSKGVINHPRNMTDPEYQGKQLLDEEGGLAGRREFSDKVDEVIVKSNIKSINAKVGSVKKQGYATKYYRIEADGNVYYAQHVVAGMGIGKHLVPKDIKDSLEKQEQIRAEKNLLPDKMPRVMDMDQFQAAISDGVLIPGIHFKTMVISGPNAAIDVATSAIRLQAIEEVFWIATNPAFLPGTDNVDAEVMFRTAFPENSTDKVKKEGKLTFYRYYYEKVEVNDKEVVVSYGEGRPIQTVGTRNADLMVYGLGPDSAELEEIFKVAKGGGKEKKLPLAAMYDINQRFNYAPTDTEEIKWAVIAYFGNENKKKDIYDPVKVEEAFEQTKGIVPIAAIERNPGQEALFKTSVSKRLPGAVGLEATKDDRWDESSLEMLGGLAYRLTGDKQYAYVSETLQDLLDNDLPERQKAISGQGLDREPLVTTYLEEVAKYLKSAVELAKRLEGAKQDDFVKNETAVGQIKESARIDEVFAGLPNGAQQMLRGNRDLIRNTVGMLTEYFVSRKAAPDDQKLSNYMLKVPKTLPKNVLLSDQLTAIRSSVEAATDAMPAQVEQGVSFITSDNTIIAAHIASAYGDIPPALADYLTARIIYDRRHLPIEEAPLPQGNNAEGFNLKKQKKFQSDWNDKLGMVDDLWGLSKIKK